MGSNVVGLDSLPRPSTDSPNESSSIFSKLQSPRSLFSDLPKATKLLIPILIVIYIISRIFSGLMMNTYQVTIGLVPGLTISQFHIWNLFTAGFYHPYFMDLISNILILLFAAKFLERFWGTYEYIKFILIVNALTGLFSFLTYMVIFYITSKDQFIFPNMPYGGFGGIVSGFAIAGRQLLPEYEISVLVFFPSRLKHMPIILLASNILFSLIGLPGTSLPFVIYGSLVSWVYLRFYQRRDGYIGDSSNSFSFVMFFPEVLHPVLDPIIRLIYIPFSSFDQRNRNASNDGQHRNLGFSSVISQQDDAERRRQKALREVDAKIAKMKVPSENSLKFEKDVEDN